MCVCVCVTVRLFVTDELQSLTVYSTYYYASAPNRRGIKRWCCLTSVCLSVAYIGPNSRTERLRKTKIVTEVAHVTRDSGTAFKVKRSKVKVTRPLYSPRRLRVKQLQRWAWVRISRGNLLLRCGLHSAGAVGSAARGASAPTEGGVGRGILWRPLAYSLFIFWIGIITEVIRLLIRSH